MANFTAGPLTVTAVGTVLADTGALPVPSGGRISMSIQLILVSTLGTTVTVEHRDSLGALVWSQIYPVAANGFRNEPVPVEYADQDRVKVLANAVLSALTIQASLAGI